MPDDPRISDLLHKALETNGTPDEACADAPDLLPEVRRRWENCRFVAAELNALFPSGPASTAPSDLPAAEFPNVPGYVVEGVLGRGGMGVVYRASHLQLRRPAAIKMLLSGEFASGAEIARFLQEARTVAGLRHPNVVQVYDVGECGGQPYFTMELMEGGTLADRLAGVPQPAARAAAVLATLAGAVDAAHQRGVVHRDLKPSNVLLTADGCPKVGDFGLARSTGTGDDAGLTLSGQLLGTRSYMAPEQASARWGPVGPAADVYALGATLYEMLTGRPPFQGETAADTERQLLAEDPVPPSRLNPRVPRDLETICLKCLRKEPALRYATAAALEDDLGRFRRGEPVVARRTGRLVRIAKWTRRRPAAAVALAASLLLVVAVAAGGTWMLSQRAATSRLVEEDLRDVARRQRQFEWGEARASLERGRARLADGGPATLRERVAQGDRDLRLVARLDAIRLDRAHRTDAFIDFAQSYHEYAAAFRDAGLGAIGDDPAVVAARIRALDIRPVLVGALDDWVVCTDQRRDQTWMTDVAQRAEGNPTDWRARARDPSVWDDKSAMGDLLRHLGQAPLATRTLAGAGAEPSISLLVTLVDRARSTLGPGAAIPLAERVQRAHPADYWANLSLGQALWAEQRYAEAARFFQAAVSVRPEAAVGHDHLGSVLGMDYRLAEAVEHFRESARLLPTSFRPHVQMGTAFVRLGRSEDAIAAYREAARLAPDAARGELPGVKSQVATLHLNYGKAFHTSGRHAEAIDQYRQSLALDPLNRQAALGVRDLSLVAGRPAEALVAWRTAIEADPAAPHADWHGHAELCLFLGAEAEFRRARQALLARYGSTADPNVAERTGRACLLLPGSPQELAKATAMVDRAVASTPEGSGGPRRHFLFAKGLAEYRAGRLESAVALMRGEASQVLGPAPHLVKAMAQHRLGDEPGARAGLASAVLTFDWRPGPGSAGDPDPWMYHVLRREAEALILTDLPAFLEGRHQPRDNVERIALTGACQFLERHAARARLWADALAADPRLADRGRAYAVNAAALAGCGQGTDAGSITEADRARWRGQACDWVRAELAAADVPGPGDAAGQQARSTLAEWSASPDLAGVRDEPGLARLPAAERAEWAAVWAGVNSLLKRTPSPK